MKTRGKKLSLAKETVRTLSNGELKGVGGALSLGGQNSILTCTWGILTCACHPTVWMP